MAGAKIIFEQLQEWLGLKRHHYWVVLIS